MSAVSKASPIRGQRRTAGDNEATKYTADRVSGKVIAPQARKNRRRLSTLIAGKMLAPTRGVKHPRRLPPAAYNRSTREKRHDATGIADRRPLGRSRHDTRSEIGRAHV